jgi:hypothetical protein
LFTSNAAAEKKRTDLVKFMAFFRLNYKYDVVRFLLIYFLWQKYADCKCVCVCNQREEKVNGLHTVPKACGAYVALYTKADMKILRATSTLQ